MVEIRKLEPEDEGALRVFLHGYVESSMFLLSNLRAGGMEDHGQSYQATYVAAFQGEAIVGVAAHCWNSNLLLQAPAHAGELALAATRESGRKLVGLLGPWSQLVSVREAMQVDTGSLRLVNKSDLYRLPINALRFPQNFRDPRVKVCNPELDLRDTLEEWWVGYAAEELLESDTPGLRERLNRNLDYAFQNGTHLVLLWDGEPVSYVGFNARVDKMVQLGPVYTPPERRRQGYARIAVAGALREAVAGGIDIAILFTGEQNVAARTVYLSLGFEIMGEYGIIFLEEPS